MGCMADYDKDCEGKEPEGCMCLNCCIKYNKKQEDIENEDKRHKR